ncbi:transcription repressor OFP13-like [Curcuma longa]|uniref:transcription repressor OFP13-like n=1 Tax=Curcuma longa TaxID=136217 RepID=UPI003D9E5B22
MLTWPPHSPCHASSSSSSAINKAGEALARLHPPPLPRSDRRIDEKIRMGKKLSLTSFLFKPSAKEYAADRRSSSSWPWLSCSAARTDSFRCLDSAESCFTRSSGEPESFSTVSEFSAGASPETVVRGLRRSAGRLLFEPSCRAGSRSLLEEAVKAAEVPPFDGAVAVAVETEDPYRDFRLSMEEMVTAHGVRDRERLWELLVWYLMVNREKTHGLIVGAFADLLAGLASSSSSSNNSEENSEEATASS